MRPTRFVPEGLSRAVMLVAAVACVEFAAAQAGGFVAEIWPGMARHVLAHGAVLGPLLGALVTVTMLIGALSGGIALGLFGDFRATRVAIGIAGPDMPFLLGGLIFVALYASLADAVIRAGGAAPRPDVAVGLLSASTLVVVVLVLPIVQEMLLRGGLLPALEARYGAAAAIVLTALAALPAIPGLAGPGRMEMLLAIGPQLFFGWIAWSCRSLGAAATLHVTYLGIRLVLAAN